jgi:hypothetical protein
VVFSGHSRFLHQIKAAQEMLTLHTKLLVASVLVFCVVLFVSAVAILYHLPNIVYVSEMSILDCPFGFL